ncbi:MAG: leucine-rich repeat domain-containing protein [Clostridia bacterium]|nr:leucine-rich repeat domain-containing protein [Clostridia bacterium]
MKTASKIVAVLLCLAMTVGALIPCVSATADVTDAQNDVLSAPLSPVTEALEEEEEIPEPAFDRDMLKVSYQFNEDKSAIRLVTTVDGLDYAEVGFVLTLGDQRARITMNEVYSSILGAGETYTPDMAGAPTSKYFALFNVTDIPTEFTLFVKAFVTTEGGDTHYGAVREIKKGSGNLAFDPNGTASGPVVSWRDLNWSGVPTHAHLFGEWITVKEPSTTEEGLMERRCACGEKETQTIERLAPALEYTLNDDGQSYSVTGIGECQETDIVIPSTYKGLLVKGIGNRAFANCSNLTGIVISDSITSIGEYAFLNCTSLANVTIGDAVTSIGDSAFYDCTSLMSITIPNGVMSIEDGAFCGCSSLTSIAIPDSVTHIGMSAFGGCSNLTSIIIPDSITSIEDGVFSGCTSLTSVKIPNNITSIGSYAFAASGISSVIFGDNSQLTRIGDCAFFWCVNLTTITYNGTIAQWDAISKGQDWASSDSIQIIFLPALEYTLNPDGKSYSVTGIGECQETDIVIPRIYNRLLITEIGNNAFNDCSKLTRIVIPNSVTRIGSGAFLGCTNLTSITIPNSVTTIHNSAFHSCTSLTSIIIPDSVTTIGASAFMNCTSLTNLTIGNSVTSVEMYAFAGCSNLTSLTFKNDSTLTTIGEGVFAYCEKLTSIVLPNSVKSIGDYMFSDCSSLTSIIFEGTVVQWNAISKGTHWAPPNASKVVCSDGIVCIKHIEVVDVAVPPTCTETGLTEGKHCSVCGEILVAQETIAVADHTFGEWSIIKDATFAEEGLKERTCICGEKETQIIEKLPPNLVYTLNADGESYSVTGIGLWNQPTLVIPDSYENLPITNIGDSAFSGCRSLTSITIPARVQSIGSRAFESCINLSSVTFEDKSMLMFIGEEAFQDCLSLTNITIPDSVSSIGNYTFRYCSSLAEISIGDGLSTIGVGAFYDCISLTSITVSDNNAAYMSKDGVLYNASGITLVCYPAGKEDTHFTIPSTVFSLGDNAFACSQNLTSVTIPSRLTNIGERTFASCKNLTSIIFDENNSALMSIDSEAFYGCTSLTSIVIPDSVTSIGNSAFQNCTNLASVTIGNGVASIGNFAFRGCSSLASVIIGNSVTSIGDYAFYGCSSLASIVIPDSVTSIGGHAFYGCSILKSIVIPDSVTSIGDWAFSGCKSLTSIVIPDGVTSIGYEAFSGCTSLTSITIDTNNKTYMSKDGVLYSKDGATLIRYPAGKTATHFTIPNGVTSIRGSAFSYCSSLTSIVIPDSVTSIGDDAFYSCSSLTSIVIPDSVTSIGYEAFYYCTSLTSITIPDGVTSIGYEAFSGCKSLTSITIDTNNKTYMSKDGVLYSKDGATLIRYPAGKTATHFTIPNGVTSIRGSAFSGCTSLTSITIPDSVKNIGEHAFSGCTSLTSITIPDSVKNIGDHAFSRCTSLTIYCEVASKPSGWSSIWNSSNRPVVWGYTG